jgi:hypothetical protein
MPSLWAGILDGTELCRVEEFAARHFRRSGFEAMFLESAFNVLFGVYFWPVVQDRCDRRVRTVGILDRHAYDQRRPSELLLRLPSDFGSLDYSSRRAKAITKHLSAIAETSAELLRLFDNWLAPSVGLRQYLWAHRRESIETARTLLDLMPTRIVSYARWPAAWAVSLFMSTKTTASAAALERFPKRLNRIPMPARTAPSMLFA